jgi:hypothetical protein
MAQESARHPVSIGNAVPYLMYFFISAPLVLLAFPFAVYSEWRRCRLSALLLLGLMGMAADLLLYLNYSTSVNWRYFLTGLPALAPLTADFLIRKLARPFRSQRLAFTSCVVVLLIIAAIFTILIKPVSQEFIERRALSKEYRHQLAKVPRDAVMISGAQTIAVTYWQAIGAGEWKTIGTGGGWPGDLGKAVDEHLAAGRRVFLDADPRWWLPCGWQRDEIPEIVALERRYVLRQVTDTIFEIIPANENNSGELREVPQLHRLLPENRPIDTKKCPPGRA